MSRAFAGVSRWRAASAAALVAVAMLAFATAAQAVKVEGGETKLTLAQPVVDAMAADGISLTAREPATLNANVLTFPIAGGNVARSGVRGHIRHRGGVSFAKGDNTVNANRPVGIVRRGRRAALVVRIRPCGRVLRGVRNALRGRRGPQGGPGQRGQRGRHRGHGRGRAVLRCLRHPPIVSVRLNDAQATRDGNTVSATATAVLTRRAARILNRRLETEVFSGGMELGSVASTIQLKLRQPQPQA